MNQEVAMSSLGVLLGTTCCLSAALLTHHISGFVLDVMGVTPPSAHPADCAAAGMLADDFGIQLPACSNFGELWISTCRC